LIFLRSTSVDAVDQKLIDTVLDRQ